MQEIHSLFREEPKVRLNPYNVYHSPVSDYSKINIKVASNLEHYPTNPQSFIKANVHSRSYIREEGKMNIKETELEDLHTEEYIERQVAAISSAVGDGVAVNALSGALKGLTDPEEKRDAVNG